MSDARPRPPRRMPQDDELAAVVTQNPAAVPHQGLTRRAGLAPRVPVLPNERGTIGVVRAAEALQRSSPARSGSTPTVTPSSGFRLSSGRSSVLETAVNGRADVVVTFNRRDFEPATAPFGIELLPPADAVRRLENRS